VTKDATNKNLAHTRLWRTQNEKERKEIRKFADKEERDTETSPKDV